MNIDDAIQGMIDCSDYEAVFIGEQFWWHKDSFLSELMHLGFGQAEAEKGLARFCQSVVAAVKRGECVSFPNYKEDLVALIAKHCRVEVVEAA